MEIIISLVKNFSNLLSYGKTNTEILKIQNVHGMKRKRQTTTSIELNYFMQLKTIDSQYKFFAVFLITKIFFNNYFYIILEISKG